MFNDIRWERSFPLVFGLMAAIAAYVMTRYGIDFTKDSSFFSAVITLGGIFSAFSVTIKSIMISNTEKMKVIEESGYKNDFFNYFSRAIDSSLILCAVGMIGFIDKVAGMAITTSLVAGLFVYCLFALRRVTLISSAMLRQKGRPNAG
ncbi:hypothetical protein [Vreelandella populi]|uniref:hypothetical protein n=1 Tax=Vreelandella populi TaxID=2498858 RepID=UPI000F8F4C2D|nr:hypothetical protein [Halomonas populi]RUR38556.1 hypothetical protein ELY25_09340 [Halomonas populi]